jgi:hypothetical protein
MLFSGLRGWVQRKGKAARKAGRRSGSRPQAGPSLAVQCLETRTVPSSLFGAPTFYPTPAQPWGVAVGDVTGDGIPDLVTSETPGGFGPGGKVSVLPGKGDGTFGPRTDYAVGNEPVTVALADLNGDGRLDIVTSNDFGDGMTVLLNNGNGTFNRTDYKPGMGLCTTVAVADLNGDGHPDIVLGDYTNSKVVVMLNNGDGTFKELSNFSVPGSNVRMVKLGDFNRDGHFDMAVTYQFSPVVSILLGNGDGTFGPATNSALRGPCGGLALADLNGDGKLDIVAHDGVQSDTVSVLLGNGNGTFGPYTAYQVGLSNNAAAPGVAVGDLNGDGHLDIVTVNSSANSLSLLLGNGDGTFGHRMDITVGNVPEDVALGKFNGDGRLDIANTNEQGNTVSVLNSVKKHAEPMSTIAGATVTEASGLPVSVPFATQNGTAGAPSDSIARRAVVPFKPVQATRTTYVISKSNLSGATNDRFFVDLLNPVSGTTGDGQAVGAVLGPPV